MKYYISYYTTEVVTADSPEEAIEKWDKGDTDMVDSDCEFDGMTDENGVDYDGAGVPL